MPPAHRPVDSRASFPELEQVVLERWRARDVFAESVRRRAGAPQWGFYEGPPTANGSPATHHVLSRVFKDIFPRYRTMCGYYVEREGGWDCHGLPVELAVEAELGMKSKEDIERYGIAEFNAICRQKVLSHVEDWNRLTERIGFWIDLDDAYRTLDSDYIESVWWALRTIHDKGLLFEKLKVVPYCPRCGTALSSHEAPRSWATSCWCGRRPHGRWSQTPPWRSTPISPTSALGPATARFRSSPRPCWSGCSGPRRTCLPGFPGASWRASATSRRLTTSPRRPTASTATRCWRPIS